MYNLEEVFKLSGLPTVTFVEPNRYNEILVSLRTQGRGVIIEGPSGIGKTMCVRHILEKIGMKENCYYLTPRKQEDLEMIRDIHTLDRDNLGTIIIDDFHLLPHDLQIKIGNVMKVLADEENQKSKMVLIGINSTGKSLVSNIEDLLTRVSIFTMEANPDTKVRELIEKGEKALNVDINVREKIIEESCGSFYICQDICSKICSDAGVIKTAECKTKIDTAYEKIAELLVTSFAKIFEQKTIAFAQGNRLRRGTRPYYTILKWFSSNNEMTINLLNEARKYSLYSGGLKQVIDKNYITRLFAKHDFLSELFFYNTDTKELCIEDPKYLYYLKNLSWKEFETKAGFDEFDEVHSYDVAISFAGAQREIAVLFNKILSEEISVFYDNEHQHELLGQSTETYLKPVYETDSKFILALLSSDYPYKYWTRVEYDAYNKRFSNKEVFPIYIGDAPSDPESAKIGFEVISKDDLESSSKLKKRVKEICEVIIQKFQ